MIIESDDDINIDYEYEFIDYKLVNIQDDYEILNFYKEIEILINEIFNQIFTYIS